MVWKQVPGAIFLNGPSSSGKSTLAKKLQNALKTPYLHIGIDKIIGMMPAQLNDWTGGKVKEGFWWDLAEDKSGNKLAHIQLGPFAHAISDFFKQVVLLALNCGHSVIIDEVCIVDESFEEWRKILSKWNTVYVGVKASTDTLEKREKERGDRMRGAARTQNLTIHNNKHYDLELDTDVLAPDACASKVIACIHNQGCQK